MTTMPPTSRLPATWREFAAFVRRPALGQPIGLRSRAGWATLGAMLGLNLAGLTVLLVLLSGYQALTGIEGPAAFEDFPKEYLLPAAVLAAPLLEESAFRGWLSGRPRALWLLGCLISGVVLMMFATEIPMGTAAGLCGLLLAGLVGWLVLRKRATPQWFAHRFAPIFFASASLFALMHVFNYAQPGLLHLPMILPQLWAGLTLGFTRNRVGLAGGMLVHGASNAIALGLASLEG